MKRRNLKKVGIKLQLELHRMSNMYPPPTYQAQAVPAVATAYASEPVMATAVRKIQYSTHFPLFSSDASPAASSNDESISKGGVPPPSIEMASVNRDIPPGNVFVELFLFTEEFFHASNTR